jgi:class 3 adenylate cyclase
VGNDARFQRLRELATPAVVDAMVDLVANGKDSELHRVNVVDFASARGLELDRVADAFVHASKLGLFDMSWNMLCPGCGGILDATAAVREIRSNYACTMCVTSYTPTLDEMVEVSFTVSPAVRSIVAHRPDEMSPVDYHREIYFAQALALPDADAWRALIAELTLEHEAVAPHEKVVLSLNLPAQFIIVFDPITHTCAFLDVKGEPVRERREIAVTFEHGTLDAARHELAPGPVRITLNNTTDRRIIVGVFIAGDKLHQLFHHRRAFYSAKQVLSNQVFRDLYRTDTLAIDQKLAISSLTVLFTDLKSSTELYERVGDLVAYDLVQKHFRVLADVVRSQGGAVVKTIGDAIMATFPSPDRGLNAALGSRDAMVRFNEARHSEDLLVKVGLHSGPCLAVMLNDRLDYFGHTVNVAARVQGLAGAQSVLATDAVVEYAPARAIIDERRLDLTPQRARLRGIKDEVVVYQVG